MISLIARLFGASSQLSPIEKLVLNSVRDQLDVRMAHLWNRQVASINKVQRLPAGVEVNFYRMRKGRPTFDKDLAFPNKANELPVAKVTLEFTGERKKLVANVWCVKGFLFSIEYDGSVAYFEEAANADPEPELKARCQLSADLSKA